MVVVGENTAFGRECVVFDEERGEGHDGFGETEGVFVVGGGGGFGGDLMGVHHSDEVEASSWAGGGEVFGGCG